MAGKGVIHRMSAEESFNKKIADWLDRGLSKDGKTNTAAGRALSPPPNKPVGPSEVSKMRRGERRILAGQLFTLAKYIEEPVPTPADWQLPTANGIKIIGEAGLPIWYENDPAASTDLALPHLPSHEFQELPHLATKTVGPAMNRVIPEGGYAVYVPYFEARPELTSGDLVLIKQGIEGRPMHKRLIRRVIKEKSGFELRASSTSNKISGERIRLAADLRHLEGSNDVIEIIGLIVWQCGPIKP